jgi:hypothetical protein
MFQRGQEAGVTAEGQYRVDADSSCGGIRAGCCNQHRRADRELLPELPQRLRCCLKTGHSHGGNRDSRGGVLAPEKPVEITLTRPMKSSEMRSPRRSKSQTLLESDRRLLTYFWQRQDESLPDVAGTVIHYGNFSLTNQRGIL